MHTLIDPALLADLAAPHPPAERLQRLASQLRAHFHCGAVVLLRLEEEHLRPMAMDGLVPEALGRRFAVRQHPRLAAILARREVVCFDHDSTLPDPYDGLLDTLVGAPLPVHDCMGVALWVEERPWGVLTLDALRTGTFGAPERAALAHCARLAEAAVRMAQLEREVQALRLAPPARAAAPAEGAAPAADPDAEIVGQSPALTQLLHELRVVASSALPVLLDERLRDRELGVLDLLTRVGVTNRFPLEAQRRQWWGKFYHRPPGGESWADVALRVRSFLRDLPDAPGDPRAVLFVHDAVVMLLRYVCEGLDEHTLLQLQSSDPVRNA